MKQKALNGPHSKKIIIIGAGIAGLCAGVYARKSGFETEILEMNSISGGLATSWKRNGYTFETCLHWLLGSKPGSPWNSLWKEVFNINDLKFIAAREFNHFESEDGQSLAIPTDTDSLEKELIKKCPEDILPIKRLVRGIRKLKSCDLTPPGETLWQNIVQTFKILPFLPELRYWSQITTEDLAKQFKHPLMREFIRGGNQGPMSAIALVFALAWMSQGDASYPIGGSRSVIQSIENQFLNLGGVIHFNARANQILIEGTQAVGIRLTDGREFRADWIVSAADGHTTLFEWIPEEFRDPAATAPYKTMPIFPSYLQVSFGIRRNMQEIPGFLTRILEAPLLIDPKTQIRHLSFRIFHFDPTFAPSGKTAVTCFIPTFNDDYWVNLKNENNHSYQTIKREIAEAVARVLERRIPGIKALIEQVDVSTPATVVRYTGNWRGSMEGFLLTPQTSFRPFHMKLQHLQNFRMIGQWVMPGGGLPSGLMTGRLCIQEICKMEHKEFLSSIPHYSHSEFTKRA